MSFGELSDSAKRKRTASIREELSAEELCYATVMKLRSCGECAAADLLEESCSSQERATEMRRAWKEAQDKSTKISPLTVNEAIALYVQAKLTKAQYLQILKKLLAKNADLLPSYDKLLVGKKMCYPESGVTVTETGVEVSLQQLLNKTTERIIEVQGCVVERVPEEAAMVLVTKWGMDGASGFPAYRHKKADGAEESMFLTCLVPLQLYCTCEPDAKKFN